MNKNDYRRAVGSGHIIILLCRVNIDRSDGTLTCFNLFNGLKPVATIYFVRYADLETAITRKIASMENSDDIMNQLLNEFINF